MYKKSRFKIALYLFAVLLFSSCFNEKKITYFQKLPNEKDTVSVPDAYVPKIQAGDLLSIYVNSLSPEASSFFNPYSANAVPATDPGGLPTGLSQSAAPGYLVSDSGKIDLPLVGSITVGGLTSSEARDVIKNKLKIYLKDPTVIIRFLNYKISILGEVNKPGIYVIPNERVTLPEALTMAGDLTNFAKRNEVQIIRDGNKTKTFSEVDLTNRALFSSPYYYLHANDILYVKPAKSKVTQTNVIFKSVPFFIAIVTAVVLLYVRLK